MDLDSWVSLPFFRITSSEVDNLRYTGCPSNSMSIREELLCARHCSPWGFSKDGHRCFSDAREGERGVLGGEAPGPLEPRAEARWAPWVYEFGSHMGP